MNQDNAFEEWYSRNIHKRGSDMHKNQFMAWQAGRASMRDECVKICEDYDDARTNIGSYFANKIKELP